MSLQLADGGFRRFERYVGNAIDAHALWSRMCDWERRAFNFPVCGAPDSDVPLDADADDHDADDHDADDHDADDHDYTPSEDESASGSADNTVARSWTRKRARALFALSARDFEGVPKRVRLDETTVHNLVVTKWGTLDAATREVQRRKDAKLKLWELKSACVLCQATGRPKILHEQLLVCLECRPCTLCATAVGADSFTLPDDGGVICAACRPCADCKGPVGTAACTVHRFPPGQQHGSAAYTRVYGRLVCSACGAKPLYVRMPVKDAMREFKVTRAELKRFGVWISSPPLQEWGMYIPYTTYVYRSEVEELYFSELLVQQRQALAEERRISRNANARRLTLVSWRRRWFDDVLLPLDDIERRHFETLTSGIRNAYVSCGFFTPRDGIDEPLPWFNFAAENAKGMASRERVFLSLMDSKENQAEFPQGFTAVTNFSSFFRHKTMCGELFVTHNEPTLDILVLQIEECFSDYQARLRRFSVVLERLSLLTGVFVTSINLCDESKPQLHIQLGKRPVRTTRDIVRPPMDHYCELNMHMKASDRFLQQLLKSTDDNSRAFWKSRLQEFVYDFKRFNNKSWHLESWRDLTVPGDSSCKALLAILRVFRKFNIPNDVGHKILLRCELLTLAPPPTHAPAKLGAMQNDCPCGNHAAARCAFGNCRTCCRGPCSRHNT